MTTVYKVLYLNEQTGEHGRLPDFGTINAGGVVGPTFFVGGKPLLFADGTSTDGTGTGGISVQVTLQQAYDYSASGTINLSAGKDFTVSALNQKIFQVDADTGRVTITGDLTVLGSSTVVEGTLANVDQVIINPPDASTTGFIIEPMVGVTMGTDLVSIRAVHAGPAVFTIDSTGTTLLKELNVAGTINGVNLAQFYADFQAHVDGLGISHTADQVAVDNTNFTEIDGSNVQEVLESIDDKLGTISAGGATIQAYEHIQNTPSQGWFITHAKNSMRPTVTIYDQDHIQVFPDEVKILDANTVAVAFGTPQAGRAILLLF